MKLSFKRKITYKNRGRFLGWGSSPDHDWRIIFSLFVFGIIVVSLYCTYLFWNTDNATLDEATPTNQITISRDSIKRIASFYQDRITTFGQLKTLHETTTDPMLGASPAGIEPTSRP